MTAAEALAATTAALNAIGEDIIVRRYTGTGPSRTSSDITTRARVLAYQPNEIIGSITQGDQKIIALATSLSGILPVTVSDKVVIRGRELAIKAVDANTRRMAGTLIALEIQAAG